MARRCSAKLHVLHVGGLIGRAAERLNDREEDEQCEEQPTRAMSNTPEAVDGPDLVAVCGSPQRNHACWDAGPLPGAGISRCLLSWMRSRRTAQVSTPGPVHGAVPAHGAANVGLTAPGRVYGHRTRQRDGNGRDRRRRALRRLHGTCRRTIIVELPPYSTG